tara:strand:+ start:617 stop:901 length:285 start_codon:yes stop_codon:yes gene_type:complete
MKLKLIYPNIPFWRAEISRLALFFGGIKFDYYRPSKEEIKKMKSDGTLPFGQFPILQVDEQTIAQTGAIARFCEKNLADYILPRTNLKLPKLMK